MNIDALVQLLWETREEKRLLNEKLKELNEQYDAYKRQLLASLDEQGVYGAKTPVARVTITESQVFKIADWENFCAYVREHDAFHLLTKKVSSTACKELTIIKGEEPPGLEMITLRDISLTTVR